MQLWKGHTWRGEVGSGHWPWLVRLAETTLAIEGVIDIAARLPSEPVSMH